MSQTIWFQEQLVVDTSGRGFDDLTLRVAGVVERSRVNTGICVLFVRHTSASLVIQENADPAVLADLEQWLAELAPESRSWAHDDEGPDDMPAHARSVLTKTSETIPIVQGPWRSERGKRFTYGSTADVRIGASWSFRCAVRRERCKRPVRTSRF